jgi:hypothetical protein
MQQLARFFSFVFHPIFVPVYMLLFVYASDPYLQYIIPINKMKPVLILLVVNTIIMPIISFLYLRKKGVFTTLFLEETNERKIGIMILFLFHLISYLLWRKLQLPASFLSLFLGILVSLASVFFITGFFKISLHTLAFGGIVGAILGLYRAHGFIDYSVLSFAILGLGIIASSRLVLNAHSPKEVNFGAILGVLILYIFSGFTLYL